MPAGATGTVSCTLNPEYRDPLFTTGCPDVPGTHGGGAWDLAVFSDTVFVFPDPAGSEFVNSQKLNSQPWYLKFFPGPKAEFRLDLDQPVAPGSLSAAPHDPYLFVRDTGQIVRLMQVDPSYRDSNGFPFGLLLTSAWKPPLEFTDTAVAYPAFMDFVNSEGASATDWTNSILTEHVVDIPDTTGWAW
jgi:hypothetical protein